MRSRIRLAAWAIVAALPACDSPENAPPDTTITAGPPEGSGSDYRVELAWDGEDPDGAVEHFEIAWDDPEAWQGPILARDSVFVVAAGEHDAVATSRAAGDSVSARPHTFWVRAVDNDGERDPTPARRSFDATTIYPYTTIRRGPDFDVVPSPLCFAWTGHDDDGQAVRYRWALSSVQEFEYDGHNPAALIETYVAWIDTLSYRPLPGGERDYDDPPWRDAGTDSLLLSLQPEDYFYIFAVRSIDDAGAEEAALQHVDNVRFFRISTRPLPQPWASVRIDIEQDCGPHVYFAGKSIPLAWTYAAGSPCAPIVTTSWAVNDTTSWTPVPLDVDELLFFPDIGSYTFHFRAIDSMGRVALAQTGFEILGGPVFCSPESRYLLVVLDTEPSALQQTQILPEVYREVERAWVADLFAPYELRIHETFGTEPPPAELADCASAVVWFHSTDVGARSGSVLLDFHRPGASGSDARPCRWLDDYVSAGGNLLVCGILPSRAIGTFDLAPDGASAEDIDYPIDFARTLSDPRWLPHWAAVMLGLARVDEVVRSTYRAPGALAAKRLSLARAEVAGYPDLPFDPLTWPEGPIERGCGFYERGVFPAAGEAEVLYTANDTGIPIAIRRHVGPGLRGNAVWLGFHPWFFQRPEVEELFRVVLSDFGVVP